MERHETKDTCGCISPKQEYLHYFLCYRSSTGLLNKTNKNPINTDEHEADSDNSSSYSLDRAALPPSCKDPVIT